MSEPLLTPHGGSPGSVRFPAKERGHVGHVTQAAIGHVLKKAFLAGTSRTLGQPAQLVQFAMFFVLPPIILASVWKAAATSSGGSIVGYSATALVWYIATSETAVLTVRNRLIAEVGDDIGSGQFAVELQRPVRALPIRLASELGFMAPRFTVGVTLAALVGLLLGGAPPSVVGVTLAVPSLALALTLNVIGQHLFAASSFWLREAKGAWFLYNKLVFVLGGMLLPLEVLPAWLETIAKFLPFMAMAYVPARLAAGFVEPWLLLVQLFWLFVALALALAAFGRGERHFMGDS
ncbi:MAG: ABC transporter permease [Acidimicrobiales bacterium]